jgi:hypothetical protein
VRGDGGKGKSSERGRNAKPILAVALPSSSSSSFVSVLAPAITATVDRKQPPVRFNPFSFEKGPQSSTVLRLHA